MPVVQGNVNSKYMSPEPYDQLRGEVVRACTELTPVGVGAASALTKQANTH
jgi:hypothetical protein